MRHEVSSLSVASLMAWRHHALSPVPYSSARPIDEEVAIVIVNVSWRTCFFHPDVLAIWVDACVSLFVHAISVHACTRSTELLIYRCWSCVRFRGGVYNHDVWGRTRRFDISLHHTNSVCVLVIYVDSSRLGSLRRSSLWPGYTAGNSSRPRLSALRTSSSLGITCERLTAR